jgi:hypothetical protein
MPSKLERTLRELDTTNEMFGNEFDKVERVERILPMLIHPYAGKHATLPIAFHECTSSVKRLSKDREHSLDTMHSVAELLNTLHSLLSEALLDRERYDPSSSNCDEDDDDDDDNGKET